jgi:hypothetical protein
MEYVANFREIDGYEIYMSYGERSVNPEATIAEVAKQAGCPVHAVYQLPNYRELFQRCQVYFDPAANQKIVDDSAVGALENHKAALGPNQLLTMDDEAIPNYLDAEYWKKTNGKWEQRKVECVGKEPDGILQDALTQEQRDEISAQQKEERLSRMTPEERKEMEIAEIKSKLMGIDHEVGAGRMVRAITLVAGEQAGMSEDPNDPNYNENYKRLCEHERYAEQLRIEHKALEKPDGEAENEQP